MFDPEGFDEGVVVVVGVVSVVDVVEDGGGEVHEAVDKLLTARLLDYLFLVVVPQGPTELVVVHVRLVLASAPQLRHLFGVKEFELSGGVGPVDDGRVLLRQQQLQQKLPQRHT